MSEVRCRRSDVGGQGQEIKEEKGNRKDERPTSNTRRAPAATVRKHGECARRGRSNVQRRMKNRE